MHLFWLDPSADNLKHTLCTLPIDNRMKNPIPKEKFMVESRDDFLHRGAHFRDGYAFAVLKIQTQKQAHGFVVVQFQPKVFQQDVKEHINQGMDAACLEGSLVQECLRLWWISTAL